MHAMIPLGTVCIVVEPPEKCEPPTLSGCFCTVVALNRGQSLKAKCNVVFPGDPRKFVVWEWSALRPIVPPRPNPQVLRDQELTA